MANRGQHLRHSYIHRLALCALAWAIAAPLLAEEIPEPFTPVRPVGMGGAYTGVALDDESVWTNPAGVARIRKARSRKGVEVLKVPNFIAGGNASGRKNYKMLLGDGDVADIAEQTTDLSTTPTWTRASMFPMTVVNLGRQSPVLIGAYATSTSRLQLDSGDPTIADMQIVSDMGGVLTFGVTNAQNRFNIGLQVRPNQRYLFEDSIPTTDLESRGTMLAHAKTDAAKGIGIGADFGMLFTMADFWFPTLGVAVLNLPTGCSTDYLNPYTKQRQTICGTKYSGGVGSSDSSYSVDPMDIRAGFSITPRLSRKVALRFAADVHHLYAGSGDTYYGIPGAEVSKLIHAGSELIFGNPILPSPLVLRVGAGQGFISYGASIKLGVLSMDFASYGVDISDTSAPQEDRRMLMSFSLDM